MHAPAHGARRTIARDITQTIIAALERGVPPWRKPWDGGRAGLPLPRRATGEAYRGINILLLWSAACDHGYASPVWLTFRQAVALGAHVRKGERGAHVVYYGQSRRTVIFEGGDETDDAYRFLKAYAVFNADQIDGLPDAFRAPALISPMAIAAHEIWFEKLGIARIVSRDIACYIHSRDVIAMPPVAAFDTAEHYAATLNHEAVHATGAKHRLDRDFTQRFGTHSRAVEELVAEMGAAILGAHHGLVPSHIEDHAAYIQSWMTVVQNEPRVLLKAAAQAQAAVDWLIAKSLIIADKNGEVSS